MESENKEQFLENSLKTFQKMMDSMSEEEKHRMRDYFKDDTPKGWLSIEEHLPMMLVNDLEKGYSVYKVKDKEGKEFFTTVTDHHIWYYKAKEWGITHWLNE